jgi:hypothetical protein
MYYYSFGNVKFFLSFLKKNFANKNVLKIITKDNGLVITLVPL